MIMKPTFCKFCVGALLFVAMPLHAQVENYNVQEMEEMRYRRQLHLTMALGGSIDLARSSDNPAAGVLGGPPAVAPAFDIRLTHLCGTRWGWYADFRLKYYVSRLEHSNLWEGIMMALSPAGYLHVGYSAGGVFRIEGTRWQCYPRVGIGQNFYGYNRCNEKEGQVWLESDGKTFCVDMGVSTQYRFSPIVGLTFDVLYRQPFTSGKAYVKVEGESGVQSYSYSSSTLGRELNVSIGLNFSFRLQ